MTIAGETKKMPDQPKIFLIGFNKCGTTSFHDYFKMNNISSIHWRANTLAMTLKSNHDRNECLLKGIDMWTAYTDMICIPGSPWGKSNSENCELIEGCRYFKYLHRDYPNALFILNTRDPFQWVRSRMKHDNGRFAKAYVDALRVSGINNRRELKRRWLKDWYNHHSDVINYFSGASSKNFLLFHISETPAKKLTKFLRPHFNIDFPDFPHNHKSID